MWKVLVLYCELQDPSRATECLVGGELTARLETEAECEAVRALPREVDYLQKDEKHPVQEFQCWQIQENAEINPVPGWVILKPKPEVDLSGNHKSLNKDEYR